MVFKDSKLTKRQLVLIWAGMLAAVIAAAIAFQRSTLTSDDLCGDGMKGKMRMGMKSATLECRPDYSEYSKAAAEAPSRTFDRDAGAPENLPFSAAVVVGDTIYLSGQIGRKPGETALVEGGVGAETRQIFENYKGILARNNASLADIVKCTVFLEDMADYAAMNAAYAEAFPGEKPARSTLGADGLAFNAAVEIECLAIRGGS